MAAGALGTGFIGLEAISSPDGQVSMALQELEAWKREGGRTVT